MVIDEKIIEENELSDDSSQSFSSRPRSFETNQEQAISDEEIFDKAKIDYTKLDKLTESKLIDGIITISEAMAGFNFYKYEKDFAQRIVKSLFEGDGATITGEFARQSGKSFTMSILAPACCVMFPLTAENLILAKIDSPVLKFKNGFWCGVYGPDYDRAAIIGNKINNVLVSRTARQILTLKEVGMRFPERLTRYLGNLPRNSFIYVKSANKRVSIEGNTFHLVITDETQEINDYVLKKSISPMLAATMGTTVHLGSAYPKKVYFYEICRQNKKEDINKSKSQKCHFENDYHVVEKYNPNYKKYIELEKKKLGPYSDEFRMSYELYWPIEKGMFITEDILIKQCGGNYTVTNYDKTNAHTISIDLAKVLDSTVVTVIEPDYSNPIVIDVESRMVRYNKKIKNWLEISGTNYDSQFILLQEFLTNYKWDKLIIDAGGVGASVFDRFYNAYIDDGTKQVIPFVFSAKTKSDAYLLTYRELLSGRIKFPNSEDAKQKRKQRRFVDQMINLSKDITSNGYLKVNHLEDTGRDDYADSLAMNVYAIESNNINTQLEESLSNIFKDDPVKLTRGLSSPYRTRLDVSRGNFWD